MKVYHQLDALPQFRHAIVTIGTFDGVHTGHVELIRQMRSAAAAIGGETVIITFYPHPRKVVSSVPGDIRLLNTPEEKAMLLEAQGIDHLVVIPFDQEFANLTAEAYVTEFLYRHFHPHTVIIGYDHHFGKGRQGNFRLMEQLGRQLGFRVQEIPEQALHRIAISSTRIREALLHGDTATADELLGYDYFFEGTVIEGNKLGRTIGYPTANLHVESEEKLIPGNGVYAAGVQLLSEGGTSPFQYGYSGMMNIGLRPTVDGKKRMIEVNIFDFDRDIYGQTLRVCIRHYLRGEVKFSGLEELKTQLGKDKQEALRLLR